MFLCPPQNPCPSSKLQHKHGVFLWTCPWVPLAVGPLLFPSATPASSHVPHLFQFQSLILNLSSTRVFLFSSTLFLLYGCSVLLFPEDMKCSFLEITLFCLLRSVNFCVCFGLCLSCCRHFYSSLGWRHHAETWLGLCVPQAFWAWCLPWEGSPASRQAAGGITGKAWPLRLRSLQY